MCWKILSLVLTWRQQGWHAAVRLVQELLAVGRSRTVAGHNRTSDAG